MTTSKKVASVAGKTLANNGSSSKGKMMAGSLISQADETKEELLGKIAALGHATQAFAKATVEELKMVLSIARGDFRKPKKS